MKPYKVVLFIFCVLAGLAVLCLVFPRQGIKVGNVLLEFPSLTEVMTPAAVQKEEALADEDAKVQARLDSVHNLKDKELVGYISKDPARFYMPGNDLRYLDDFFKALDNAGKVPVRIMHYGDSQLEEDNISGDLREHMQDMFGGGGVGMQPAVQLVPKQTVIQTTTPEALERHCAYGAQEWRGNSRDYGPMAQASHVYTGTTVSFTVCNPKRFPHAGMIDKITVAMSGTGSISAVADGRTYTLKAESNGEGIRIYSTVLDSLSRRVKVTFSGNMNVYGISLENKSGVILDNIPMRGCSGTIFTNIKENSFAPFFKEQNIRLIILQFGGNSVSLDMGKAALAQYRKVLTRQIRFFKSCAPKAKILFIGPADMATNIRGQMLSYPCMKDMVQMLREMCNDEGCAFWDMYTVMGGDGSMVKWVDARPALAYHDYVHFTPRGARRMSDILFGTMKMYYDYYKFRTSPEPSKGGGKPTPTSTKGGEKPTTTSTKGGEKPTPTLPKGGSH